VEPRGFEPLTSAVQRQFEGLAAVRRRSEKRINQLIRKISHHGRSPLFASVVVKLSSTNMGSRASVKEALRYACRLRRRSVPFSSRSQAHPYDGHQEQRAA
jgi:hypothetical protein